MHYLFVPSHPIWLPSSDDVEARIAISRSYLRSTANSSIGFEALQKVNSLSMSVFNSQVSTALAIRKELGNEGVETLFSVHAPYTPIEEFSLASESSLIRTRTIEAVKKCTELGEDIGASVVNIHIGGIVKTTNERSFTDPAVKRATLNRIEDALTDIISKVEERNLVLAVENVPYPLEETPAYSPVVGIFPRDFSEILKDVDSKSIAVTVDFCHLWITHKTMREFVSIMDQRSAGGKTNARSYPGLTSYDVESIKSLAASPFEAFIKPLCDRIIHIHAADSVGTYVPGMSRVSEGEPLGEGDLDLDGFADSLKHIESCSPSKSIMIVLESKEADFSKPLNTLKSLLRLDNLIETKIRQEKKQTFRRVVRKPS